MRNVRIQANKNRGSSQLETSLAPEPQFAGPAQRAGQLSPGILGFLPFWGASQSESTATPPNSTELLVETVERVQEV